MRPPTAPEAHSPTPGWLPSGPERRGPSPHGCRRDAALWLALWWLPNTARLTFDPPGTGKCMVVVVNGLLSNGRLPHAYYYKRPRPVEWLNHLYAVGLREHWAHA